MANTERARQAPCIYVYIKKNNKRSLKDGLTTSDKCTQKSPELFEGIKSSKKKIIIISNGYFKIKWRTEWKEKNIGMNDYKYHQGKRKKKRKPHIMKREGE
jgi:hypothetical protein